MVAIIDCGMGNSGAIANMLLHIGVECSVSAEASLIASASHIILPGVGAFDSGMRQLHERNLLPVLNSAIERGKPILGICLGMQLMGEASEEGTLPGLGWLKAHTVRFTFTDGATPGLRVPHMGWNNVRVVQSTDLLRGLEHENRFYFVHSFHMVAEDPSIITAWTNHGYDFAAVVHRKNIFGVQFHPEKSHRFGMQLLKNFTQIQC